MHKRGRLVNWIEKAGLENIRHLPEIIETERNHELFLTTRNFRELAPCAFPYIIPYVPHSLPVELIEGEHFILTDLCKSTPGSSFRAVAAQEDQVEATTAAVVRGLSKSRSPKVRSLPPGLKRRNEIGRGPNKLKQLAPG